MDFNSILGFLQNLLTNKQNTQSTQFNQGLGFQGQQLTAQQAEEAARLAEQSRARQAAESLAREGQRFSEAQTNKETSFPFLEMMNNLQQRLQPATELADSNFLNKFKRRIAASAMGTATSPYAIGPDSPFTFFRAPGGI